MAHNFFIFQEVEACSVSISGRILMLGWWFFILIIVQMYGANLAAFLTVLRLTKGMMRLWSHPQLCNAWGDGSHLRCVLSFVT